jgi:cell division protein FtsB
MTRGAQARLALGALAFVAILFVAQRRQVSTAQHDVDVLRQQNDQLQAQARQLQTAAEIEQMAREQFHYVKPGEQVYDVVPVAVTPPGTITTTTTVP